jgi:hypothetical protein
MFTDPTASLFVGFFTNGAASLINAGLVSLLQLASRVFLIARLVR